MLVGMVSLLLVSLPSSCMPIVCLAILQAIYLLILELSLDNLKQGSVCDFDLAISLKMGGGGVVVLYS